jgi:predicted phage terminase large subunit-like protein
MTSVSDEYRVRQQASAQFDAATAQDFLLFLRRSLLTVNPGGRYSHNWHIAAIAEYLAAAARGEITRLVINLPPRMLKSTIVSVAWPAWLLGQNPRQRLMVASYAQTLATKHSTDCRLVMQSDWYRRIFPNTRLSDEQNEKDRFATTQRGQRLAVSVGGAAVGEGGNILIVDDPLNPLQSTHGNQRDAANAWFDHTFASRLDDKKTGCIIVVMQRLHRQDLSGYLLEKGGWEHLCLPAIAPTSTTIERGNFRYTRSEGEAFHAGREDIALLKRTQQEMGSANFAAQYQQAPQKISGAVVKPVWFARFEMGELRDGSATGKPSPLQGGLGGGRGADGELANAPPPSLPRKGGATERVLRSCDHRIIQSWDTAMKTGQGRDASACATFLERDGVHYLIDMLAAQMEYPELKRAVVAQAERFAPEVILIEDKASGQSLLQDLRVETNLPLLAQIPDADKLSRLLRVTPMMEAGKVALPKFAPWLAALEEELFGFPDARHDDQVDAISQYLNWLRKGMFAAVPTMRRL